jgi:tetraacyldisaccharide 4'-kinase
MTLPLPVRLLFWPLSVVYGALTQLRAWLYVRGIFEQRRLSRPVISVGNLTVGGTGKTPMVIWLAERFLAEGKRVGVLSRGYKGNAGTSDEIELMKSRLRGEVHFGVGTNRFAQGKKLEGSVDMFLLDDGFQHLDLARDVNILLVDSSEPLAKQAMLPTGRLREPVSAMVRADALVFTRAETVSGASAAIDKFGGHPVFSAATRLLGFRRYGAANQVAPKESIAAGPLYGFCGIGNPRAFFKDLKNWGLTLASQCEFSDHHRYDRRDAVEITNAARNAGAKALVTTEKDEKNLSGIDFAGFPLYIAVIEMEIAKETSLLTLIRERIEAGRFAA